MMKDKDLPITEELDFSYLLGLMRPLASIDEYAALPELFTILGHERLIDLCRYAGGETIAIPTLDELSNSIDALQYFYDVYIVGRIDYGDIPSDYLELVTRIKEIYDARNCKEAS